LSDIPGKRGASSIREFCDRNGPISVSSFYKMKARGEAPAIMNVGDRVLISSEAEEAWRRDREKAAAEKAEG
jgi:prefoldin subunit 5